MTDGTSTEPQLVEWDDENFTPETRPQTGDHIRLFRMSHNWPEKPFDDRPFQLGGKERIAILEPAVYVTWVHRYSVQWSKSTINGPRRCSLEDRGHCVACQHYDAAPTVVDADGKKKKDARCRPRQQLFGVNVLVYKTDLDGNLLDEHGRQIILDPDKGPIADGAPAKLVVQSFLWQFNGEKFQDIRNIKREWGDLRQYDLQFTLAPNKKESFQDFSAQPMRQSAWFMLSTVGRKDELDAIVKYYKDTRYDVSQIMGKTYSDDEIKGFLGIGGTPPPNAQAVNDVAASIAAEIEKATGGTGSGNVDITNTPAAQPAPTQTPPPAQEPAAPPPTPTPQPQTPPTPTTDLDADFNKLLAG